MARATNSAIIIVYHKGKDAQTLLQISKFHIDYHICVLVSSCLFTMTEIEVRNDQ